MPSDISVVRLKSPIFLSYHLETLLFFFPCSLRSKSFFFTAPPSLYPAPALSYTNKIGCHLYFSYEPIFCSFFCTLGFHGCGDHFGKEEIWIGLKCLLHGFVHPTQLRVRVHQDHLSQSGIQKLGGFIAWGRKRESIGIPLLGAAVLEWEPPGHDPEGVAIEKNRNCLLYTSPSPRD